MNPPSSNFHLILWKWGSVPVSEYEPVVVIPDILNSWQTDSGPVLDPIFLTYQNLLDTFTQNGYVSGQTLFTFPYNWENSLTTTAQALQTEIQTVKSTCGCSRVNIVAHGTGGLIAQQYIESVGYGSDVDQLVLLGTPQLGVPAAYQAWEGGQVSFGSPISDDLAQVLLQAQAKDGGFSSAFNLIQQAPIQSFKDILPTYNYLYKPGTGLLTYPTGYPQNTFLDNLTSNIGLALSRVRNSVVLADDQLGLTTSLFFIGPSTQPPLWPEGQPTDTVTDLGDGMVPRASIEDATAANREFDGVGHRTLPTAAESYAFQTLNNKTPTTVNNNYAVSCVLFVSTSPGSDMLVTDPNGLELGKDFTNNVAISQIPRSLYSGFNAPTEYAVVANPQNGIYTVQSKGTNNGTITINTSDVCGQNVVSTSTSGTISSGQLVGYGLTVSTSTQTLSLAPLDTQPPTITITSPTANATYFDTSTLFLSANITDASPIAGTSYTFDGNVIDPSQPLPLIGAPLGTSTVSVAATDIYGNAASSTRTFFIKSSDAQPPTIVITNPLAGHTYTATSTVYATATISDASGVATSSYFLDDTQVNPSQPLPFSAVPPGTTTVTVAATDNFGNATSTSVVFTVWAPSASQSDTQPPVITITSPVQGSIHQRDEKLYVTATVSDQSPISSVKYYFNGAKIDQTKPLDLRHAPLGISTVVVKATDKFGNIGYATSTFKLLPSNDNCIGDITEAFDQKSIKDKQTFTKLFNDCRDLDRYHHDRDDAWGHFDYNRYNNDNQNINQIYNDFGNNIWRKDN